MTQIETPAPFKDASQLLSTDGFKSSGNWYHGTPSGLAAAILKNGLIGSGDADLNQMAKKAMATIGNSYTERKEPVFLTQSKELAYYWANEKVQLRKLRFGVDETAVVIELNLPEALSVKVKPDVGAATMLLEDNNAYIEHLRELYAEHKLLLPELDPVKIDRMAYLNQLGMAYIDNDITSEHLSLLAD